MDTAAIKLLIDIQHEAYKNAMELFVSQLTNKIDASQAQIMDLAKSLEYIQADVADLKYQVKQLIREKNEDKRTTMRWQDQIQSSSKLVEDLESKDSCVDKTSHNSLCIEGILEAEPETLLQLAATVTTLFQEKLEMSDVPLEQVYRVGQRKCSRPRSVLVIFCNPIDRDVVLRRSRMLHGTKIFIYESLCPTTQNVLNGTEEERLPYLSHAELIAKYKGVAQDSSSAVMSSSSLATANHHDSTSTHNADTVRT